MLCAQEEMEMARGRELRDWAGHGLFLPGSRKGMVLDKAGTMVGADAAGSRRNDNWGRTATASNAATTAATTAAAVAAAAAAATTTTATATAAAAAATTTAKSTTTAATAAVWQPWWWSWLGWKTAAMERRRKRLRWQGRRSQVRGRSCGSKSREGKRFAIVPPLFWRL